MNKNFNAFYHNSKSISEKNKIQVRSTRKIPGHLTGSGLTRRETAEGRSFPPSTFLPSNQATKAKELHKNKKKRWSAARAHWLFYMCVSFCFCLLVHTSTTASRPVEPMLLCNNFLPQRSESRCPLSFSSTSTKWSKGRSGKISLFMTIVKKFRIE